MHTHPHTHTHNGRIARNKVTIAAVAVGALALGGGSLALWSDSADLDAAAVATGHLDLNTKTQAAYDISSYQVPESGSPENWTVSDGTEFVASPINLETFKFVPGDVVAVTVPIEVELEGNNLAAQFSVESDTAYSGYGFTTAVAGIYQLGTSSIAELLEDIASASPTSDDLVEYVFTESADDYYAIWTISFDDSDNNGLDDDLALPDGPGGVDYMDVSITDIINATSIKLTQVRPSSGYTPSDS